MNKFKVGDKVEILWEKTGYLKEQKKVGTITEISSDGKVEVNISPDHTLSFEESALKPIKTMELKIGDKVRGKYGEIEYTGEVIYINDNEATIERDDGEEGGGYEGGWYIEKKPDGSWSADTAKGTLEIISAKTPETSSTDEIELSLSPELQKLLQKNIPSFIKKGYLDEKLKITPKGQRKLFEEIFKKYGL